MTTQYPTNVKLILMFGPLFSSNFETVDNNAYDTGATTLDPVQLDRRMLGGSAKPIAALPVPFGAKAAARPIVSLPGTAKPVPALPVPGKPIQANGAPASTVPSTAGTMKNGQAGTGKTCKIRNKSQGTGMTNGKTPTTGTTTGHTTGKGPRSLRFMRRGLKSVPQSAAGTYALKEDHYVSGLFVRSGNHISVIDVAGCSGVFMWDHNNIPSVFHIFSGDETVDGAAAGDVVLDADISVAAVTIVAETDAKYNLIHTALTKVFACAESTPTFIQDNYDDTTRVTGQRWKFEVTAGNRAVTKTIVPMTQT